MVREHTKHFKTFQNELLRMLREKKVPIILLKFEELRKTPRESLLDVFRFLLKTKDLEGRYIEHRIDQILDLGHEATQQYKMKKTDGKFNAIDRFTPEQQKHVLTELGPFC